MARPADDLSTPTLSQVVRRAVDVCDPGAANDGLASLLRHFEDRDEPVSAVGDIGRELAEATGAVDPQEENPAVVMAAAVIAYLAHRRTELEREPEELLRLAARAEFDGRPPEAVQPWLAERGVDV